jgi:hypothetical protein
MLKYNKNVLTKAAYETNPLTSALGACLHWVVSAAGIPTSSSAGFLMMSSLTSSGGAVVTLGTVGAATGLTSVPLCGAGGWILAMGGGGAGRDFLLWRRVPVAGAST